MTHQAGDSGTAQPTIARHAAATRKPSFTLPALSCDCHAHVFGPQSRFPYHPDRKYTPHEASLADYLAMLKALGIERGVLVQPTVYKDNNSALLDALETSREIGLRGIAVAAANVTEETLQGWHNSGIRGLRLNVRDGAGLENAKLLAAKIKPLGWHIDLRVSDEHLLALSAELHALPVDIAIAHFGQPDVAAGIDGTAFRSLLDMLGTGRCWIKLSAPMRSSRMALPYADVMPLIAKLVAENPERLLWGSDWPHTRIKGEMPDDGDLCDLLPQWIPDAETRDRILAANPAALYGFGVIPA